jgi:hypothetical protein
MKQITTSLLLSFVFITGCSGDGDIDDQKSNVMNLLLAGSILLSILAIGFASMKDQRKKEIIRNYILTIIFLGVSILLFSGFGNNTEKQYYGFKALCIGATLFFFFQTPIGRNIFRKRK